MNDRHGYPKVAFKGTKVEGQSIATLAPEHIVTREEGYNRMCGGVNYRFQCSCGALDATTTGKDNRPAQSHLVQLLGLVWSNADRCFTQAGDGA